MADSTSGVGSTYTGTSYEEYMAAQNAPRELNSELGKDDFLNLMVAQMQYQDPLEPTKDSDFVAQLAQFSSLEQMSAVSNSTAATQAYNLVGKCVFAEKVHLGNGEYADIVGFVDSVFSQDGEYYASINDEYLGQISVKVSKIGGLYDTDSITGANPLLENASLIGRIVTGNIVDTITTTTGEGEDEKTTETTSTREVTGTVIGVGIEDGLRVARIRYTNEAGETVEESMRLDYIFDIRDAGALDNKEDTLSKILDLLEESSSNNYNQTNSGTDATNSGTDATDNGTDAGDNGTDATDSGTDATDSGTDVTDNGMDATDNGMDATDNGTDATDNGTDAGDTPETP